ncbi:Membrane associated serine protease, rhomboid family [Paucidesulfovibrio gracilis DSM 16080]|uniref:Membrane associated serine protease, rhomboid family n=1 Tax=Paucidesulfovibrio gracilis DSM 16080 TaxID=1121449 RepID=A0A1T4WB18_9BACT|nr:rhomboid family intramembrane serine protease [Paucidesulfovibrio gracilis]SKA74482.1 Membrane associated serine protease, rhomboid family [Paucidesulfovibrio gracilis DSM 16080]
MIPLYDNVPRVHPPYAVLGILVCNVLAFLYELQLSPQDQMFFFHLFGVVPARFSHPGWAFMAGYPDATVWPFLTYMFLHADWLHLILNMWMLWIFADNIEDVTGHWRFLGFYICCGLAAVLLHLLFNPTSPLPIIGASGAVAGTLGAYMVLYPHGRVTTLVLIFIFQFRAALFLSVWFGVQILSGIQETSQDMVAGVAWWAHVGGFLAGMVLIRFFRRKDRCYYCYNSERKYYDLLD